MKLWYEVRNVNARYKLLERRFLYKQGLDGREWFKHVVFAPGIWTGYAGATYPGLVERIGEGDLEGVERWEGVIGEKVEGARKGLGEGRGGDWIWGWLGHAVAQIVCTVF